jgi:hypothetical protein
MTLPPVALLKIAIDSEDTPFFEYACDRCNAPVCERQTLIALTLGVEEAVVETD